jgi:hypothetical protein
LASDVPNDAKMEQIMPSSMSHPDICHVPQNVPRRQKLFLFFNHFSLYINKQINYKEGVRQRQWTKLNGGENDD